MLGASGHIAGVINPPAKSKRNHWVGKRVGRRRRRPGWTARNEHRRQLVAGLDRLAGQPCRARWSPRREQPGNAEYPSIEAGPGRYVKAKAA